MNLKKSISKIQYFIEREIWIIDLSVFPFFKKVLYKFLQIVIMTFKGFNEDRVQLRASALTYYSLLSIVPIFAMAFGIAKGFGLDEKLTEIITEKLSAHQEIMHQVINFANTMLNNTKGGVIAGIGVVLLLWSVLKVMSHIEESFNAIWGIGKGRSIIRKFTEYIAIMIVGPILLILSSSLTVYISSKTEMLVNNVQMLHYAKTGVSFFLGFSPYFVFWLLLTMVYMVMPNTKVKFLSALVGGVISGTLFVLVQWAYVKFQIGVSQFNAIYGSFAALPLFLIWLRISWLIVLFGAELSFSYQNLEIFKLSNESENISLNFKKKLSVYIVHYVVKEFYKGNAPTIQEIKNKLSLPFKVVSKISEELIDSGIFSKIDSDNYKEMKLQPAIDTSKISITFIIKSLEKTGKDDIPIPESSIFNTISQKVDNILCNDDDVLLKNID